MEAQMAVTKDELQSILEASPFARIYDFKLDFVAYGECRLLFLARELMTASSSAQSVVI